MPHSQTEENTRRLRTDVPAPRPSPARIRTIGIPTRDRAASLERCLAAWATGVQREDAPNLVVVDDSTEESARAASQNLLGALKGRYAGQLYYVDGQAKAQFARQLAAHSGLDPDDVSFALVNVERCPIATGTSRNLLLLHAAGEALLQLDDDVVCRFAPAPSARPEIALATRYDPTEFWFPECNDHPEEAPFTPCDLPMLHEQLLGRGVDELFEQSGGRVRVTAAGVAGDAGMSSSLYFLLLDGPSRERLLQSEVVYRAAIKRRQVLRAVTRPTIARSAVCQALNLGLDHRELLPPFMPVQRNQDGIFGALVRTCCEGAHFGFLPSVLCHEPPAVRTAPDGELVRGAVAIRSDQILQLLIRTLSPLGVGDTGRNLRAVGAGLAALGAAPGAEFANTVQLLVAEQTRGLAGQLDALLQKHGGQPAWWAADVQRVRSALHERLSDPDLGTPSDLQQAFGREHALPVFQRLVTRFGRLLQCWPDMVEAARDLRAAGIRPATPV